MRSHGLRSAWLVVAALCAAVAGLWLAVLPAGAASLPDSRAYEMVSPVANADGNVYVPSIGDPFTIDITSERPYRASADGNAVAYAGDPPSSGGSGTVGNGLGNEFLATRAASGWTALDIQPPGYRSTEYQAFSSDLSVGIFRLSGWEQPPLTADAPANCALLYSRTTGDGAYHTATTTTQTPGNCGWPEFAGISADNSRLIFESTAALTPDAPAAASEEEQNLYESVAGQPYLVNVLPNGTPDVNAAFGSPPEVEIGVVVRNFGQVISSDGSRIFWSDLNTHSLYVRENAAQPQSPVVGGKCAVPADACTVQVDAVQGGPGSSGGGRFWTASSNGSKVFFTDVSKLTSDSTATTGAPDLYEYEEGALTDLTVAKGGEHANVKGVVGSSEDGSYVYFVAGGVLAENENANQEKAKAGVPNLYVRSGGVTTFIATLSPEDDTFRVFSGQNQNAPYGDWRPMLKMRTAEVTPDGRHLLFMSRQRLTGYDNRPVNPRAGYRCKSVPRCPEVFVYDAGTPRISCASCNPSGERPVVDGSYLPFSWSNTYLLRWISDDGSRVFFDSTEPLVPQDTNGVQDVYEWERDGAGSCRQSGGCVYLISGNLSSDESYLVDASASGNDVFFTSRAQLVPQDRNGNVDLYDARVNGGFPQLSLECTGTGCQGVPSAPPIFATPSSVTFNGVGNFAPPSKAAVKPKAKPKKCKRGFVKKHGRCVKNVKKKAKKSSRRSEGGRK